MKAFQNLQSVLYIIQLSYNNLALILQFDIILAFVSTKIKPTPKWPQLFVQNSHQTVPGQEIFSLTSNIFLKFWTFFLKFDKNAQRKLLVQGNEGGGVSKKCVLF